MRHQLRQRSKIPLPASTSVLSNKVGWPTQFNILDAPLEIRRLIYAFALPCQNQPVKSEHWAIMTKIPCNSMNLLLANKQISNEAREMLYGSNAFTAAIDDWVKSNFNFLYRYSDIADFSPILPTVSARQGFIKHLQFNLRLDLYTHRVDPLRLSPHRVGMGAIAELGDGTGWSLVEVKAAVDAIEHTLELQTLKIKLPCLCKIYFGLSIDEVIDALSEILKPLRRLRKPKRIIFITARCTSTPDPNGLPKFGSFSNTQCPRPICQTFASTLLSNLNSAFASFEPFRHIAKITMTRNKYRWNRLKKQVDTILCSDLQACYLLLEVWCALEDWSQEILEQRFEKAERYCSEYTLCETRYLRSLDH